MNRFTSVFKAAVERAQREGGIAADKDPAVLARFLVSSVSGLKTMVKAGIGGEAIRRIIPVVLKALD